jgi:hypothetical protein
VISSCASASINEHLSYRVALRRRSSSLQKQTFDDVAPFVDSLVVVDFLLAIGLARNVGLDTVYPQRGSNGIGIVAFVGKRFRESH